MRTFIKWTVSWLAMVFSLGILILQVGPWYQRKQERNEQLLKRQFELFNVFLVSLCVYSTLNENIKSMGQKYIINIRLVITVLFLHTALGNCAER